MTALGLIAAILFLPNFSKLDKIKASTSTGGGGYNKPRHSPIEILSMFNPTSTLRMLLYPNILLAVRSSIHHLSLQSKEENSDTNNKKNTSYSK